MNTAGDSRLVGAQVSSGILLERYWYEPGPPVRIPRHVHDTYQLGIALDHGGEYHYRGTRSPVPVGRLTVIHPGEPHEVYDLEPVPVRTRYLMMYLEPRLLLDAAGELGARGTALPFFPELSLRGPKLAQIFADLFDPSASQLEWDGWLLTFLIRLTADHAQAPLRSAPQPSARPEVRRARDYLRAHFADNVALAELAEIAGLSRFHLLRLFRAEFGVPPHAYQRMLRVEHAKRLLARGLPPGRVAAESGFFDQSHFGEHFRRMVGVTPSRYKALQQ